MAVPKYSTLFKHYLMNHSVLFYIAGVVFSLYPSALTIEMMVRICCAMIAVEYMRLIGMRKSSA